MIKRLKLRFIIVNMSILTCVLISILVSIFILMYSSEVKLSYELMESISNQKNKVINNFDNVSSNIIDYGTNEFRLLNNEFDDYFNNNEKNQEPPWRPPDSDPNNYPDDNMWPFPDEHPKDDDKPFVYTSPPLTSEPYNIITEFQNNQNNTETTVVKDKEETKKYNSVTEPAITNPVNENNVNNETEKKNQNDIKNSTESSQNKITKVSSLSKTTVVTNIVSKKIPDEKQHDENFPDPFKGKVKRTYIYIEFNDINHVDSIIYQYCDSENDEAVKKAAVQIFNSKKDRGKISIDKNKYRYLLKYNPPKDNYSIVFLDRTLEISTINRLLFIFIIITGIGLIFIFFISILLANWTIKPVAKAWDQQKQFIADASHELKTPLTVISTNTDVILSNSSDTVESQSKWLNYIKNETIRMTKLVNSLLYIAKYDANETKILFKKINLSNIISSICLQYEPLIYENNKKLITDIDNNITIMGDEDKIKQLLNILMDNALKYSLNNGIIKISLKKNKQSNVYITVSNSSETINKEQLNKIFDRFFRIDSSRNRKTGGSGLGLNIAKSIVEIHKGSINVMNKDNITSFIITF
ncbi:HAMP domain-containing sensor histidine kinase [Porcipelethomonas sp.]|uniref:sensor histidine kinase n=1 Tax=Porcipelethomonas sp. TaxID=2981675 RepID=UPI003079E033